MGSPPPSQGGILGTPAQGVVTLDALPGVRRRRLVRHLDPRGSFRELWRASWDDGAAGAGGGGVRQINLSTSAGGVLRGLHLHRRQDDVWVVLEGHAFVALVDLRPLVGSTTPPGRPAAKEPGTRPPVAVAELAADDWLGIPAGVAHGFLALASLTLLYLVTAEYDGTDELGFAWDDPLVGVPWPPAPGTPDGRPILSPRDASAPPLADLLRSLAGG